VHLYELPMIFILIGLALYTVLGGADFGAGMWQLLAGRGESAARLREHVHESMAPVWEANHVWLIFVITVLWTSYPAAFGSIFSTLSLPLFAAALGIILRGVAYALRGGARNARELGRVELLFSLSSLLVPFAFGACVGAIASGRVPVGNARGSLIGSWTSGASVAIGAIAVLSCAYLAAVYLAADARRHGRTELLPALRMRALGAGVTAGAAAIAGVAVMHADAPALYRGLTSGGGLAALIVSLVAGIAALGAVWAGRFEPARYLAALAVAAIIAGWALAQQPLLLPGLTIRQAAAPHDTLVLVTVSVLVGAVLLFPSLGLLFGLFLGGQLGGEPGQTPIAPGPSAALAPLRRRRGRLAARAAAALFVAGLVLVVFAAAMWLQVLGALALIGAVLSGFAAVDPARLAAGSTE
jgi:cytochrome d ubiquinol oxidase subunit II